MKYGCPRADRQLRRYYNSGSRTHIDSQYDPNVKQKVEV
jgi:hypothetical protein